MGVQTAQRSAGTIIPRDARVSGKGLRHALRVLVPLMAIVTVGCSHSPALQIQNDTTYRYSCVNGRSFTATFSGGDKAVVELGDRREELTRKTSATDGRYTNGPVTLTVNEDKSLLEANGVTWGVCSTTLMP